MMNEPGNRPGPSAALALLGITIAAYFLQQSMGDEAIIRFALWPLATEGSPLGQRFGVSFAPWQLVTYGFMHGGIGHLFFNMFALFMFGRLIESAWGTQRFVIFYFVCMIGAGLVQMGVAVLSGEVYPTIGASGAVFGLLLAFGMMYPNHRIMLLIPPVPMKAKWFVIGYGVLTLVFGMTGMMPGIAEFAHLGGMLFGLILILYWGRQDYYRRRGDRG